MLPGESPKPEAINLDYSSVGNTLSNLFFQPRMKATDLIYSDQRCCMRNDNSP